MKILKNNKGFSLVEVIVATIIFAIISVPLASFIYTIQRSYKVENDRIETQQKAREALDSIMKDLKSNASDTDVVYVLDASDKIVASGTEGSGMVIESNDVNKKDILYKVDLSGVNNLVRKEYNQGSAISGTGLSSSANVTKSTNLIVLKNYAAGVNFGKETMTVSFKKTNSNSDIHIAITLKLRDSNQVKLEDSYRFKAEPELTPQPTPIATPTPMY